MNHRAIDRLIEHQTHGRECGCERAAGVDRRAFLRGSVAGTLAAASATAWLPRVSLAGTAGSGRDTLVVVFLRGGMDGLTLCAPYGDSDLYLRRPTLAIQPPGSPDGAVDLDGFFGLAPAAGRLLVPYQAGNLAFVHASGLPDPSRSHFDMQTWMEYGVTGAQAPGVTTGWVGRYLQSIAPPGAGLLRGVGIGSSLPKSFAGAPASVPIPNPATFDMPGAAGSAAARRAALTSMYSPEPAPLGPAALDTFATIDLLATIDFDNYVPSNGAVYSATTFGTSLRSAAAMIKADIGIECIEVDLGGWDLHSQLGPLSGTMAALMDQLSESLAAFHLDLGDASGALGRTTLVAMSEFGRRAAENGSDGADHGHGNALLVLGGHVNGGQVVNVWPGLAPANLDNGDLAITIDYREILAEILAERMACTNLDGVFPGWSSSGGYDVAS